MKRGNLQAKGSLAPGSRLISETRMRAVSPSNPYADWKKTHAIPYLDSKFGRRCSETKAHSCNESEGLDVAHILPRSTYPHLKMSLFNVRYLCRNAHSEEHA